MPRRYSERSDSVNAWRAVPVAIVLIGNVALDSQSSRSQNGWRSTHF